MISNQLLPIHLKCFGIKSGHFLHQGTLNKHETCAENIRFVDVVLSKSRIAVDDMCFPEYWWQILGCSSYSGHSERLFFFVVGIIKIIFALSKVNNLDFVVGHDEEIGWLEVSVTYPFALKKRAGWDEAAIHCNKFCLGPEEVSLLSFSVQWLEISVFIHELSDDANLECVVSGFAQEISVVLDDVGVILNFSKLLGFFFELIELIKCFGFDFFEGVKLASGYM